MIPSPTMSWLFLNQGTNPSACSRMAFPISIACSGNTSWALYLTNSGLKPSLALTTASAASKAAYSLSLFLADMRALDAVTYAVHFTEVC